MILFLMILGGFIFFWHISFNRTGFNNDYLSKNQTKSIKGIFCFLIFCSHLRQYISSETIVYNIYSYILNLFGQLMVALFLFYSGYGVMVSYKNKDDYAARFFHNRILKTWLNFAVAVVCFLLVDSLIGIKYPSKTILLSFLGWTSVGNSNWFMFVILALYLFTFLCFKIDRFVERKFDTQKAGFIFQANILFVSLGLLWILSCYKESYWYDTLLCYSAGVLYAAKEKEINKFLFENKYYYIAFFIMFSIFACLYVLPFHPITSNIKAVVFSILVIMVTMKFKIDNPVLRFLGKYSFFIYIYQRIPMMIVRTLWPSVSVDMFVIVVIPIVIVLSMIMYELCNLKNKRLLMSR